LAQAVEDAERSHRKGRGGDAWLRRQARRWLLGDSGQLRLICEAAGYNPDVMRERVRKRYAKQHRRA